MALCEHIFEQVCDEYDLLEPVMADYRQEGYFNPNQNLYPPNPNPNPNPTPTPTPNQVCDEYDLLEPVMADYRQEG